jgi:hypothetical protein
MTDKDRYCQVTKGIFNFTGAEQITIAHHSLYRSISAFDRTSTTLAEV